MFQSSTTLRAWCIRTLCVRLMMTFHAINAAQPCGSVGSRHSLLHGETLGPASISMA